MILLARDAIRSVGRSREKCPPCVLTAGGAEGPRTTKRGSRQCCRAAGRLLVICTLRAPLNLKNSCERHIMTCR